MQIGIMTRMLTRPTLGEVAGAIRSYGFHAVQLNLSNAGLAPLPAELGLDTARRIGDIFRAHGLRVAAVSASFNAIHPDASQRFEGIRRAGLLASRCAALGTGILTFCTGTRDPQNMWRRHPENSNRSAWNDLVSTTRTLLRYIEEYGLTLAFEPEVANVIDSAAKAAEFLAEIDSPHLKVLFDPANLIHPENLADTRAVLRDAFARLGGHIALAHAKDAAAPLASDSECRRVTAGSGSLDYRYYLEQLRVSGFEGALVLHDLAEPEIENCRSMLESMSRMERPPFEFPRVPDST